MISVVRTNRDDSWALFDKKDGSLWFDEEGRGYVYFSRSGARKAAKSFDSETFGAVRVGRLSSDEVKPCTS